MSVFIAEKREKSAGEFINTEINNPCRLDWPQEEAASGLVSYPLASETQASGLR
jgi:hypothetical protein